MTTDFFDVAAGEIGFQVARGRLLNVTSENAGTWLAADITIGATTLTFETEVGVGDEFVFDTGEIITIATVTPDTDGLTATVALPVTGDHSEGEHLSSWPLKPYPLAMVSISELDDDPVQALIPAALQPFLAEGPRTDADTEFVVIERNDQDERWWVTQIPGEVAIVSAGGITPGDMPVGTIVAWTSGSPPVRWLICDGAAVSRADYPDLFAVIGTVFGAGDGTTTFNIPNLYERFIRHRTPVGATGGAATHDHGVGTYDITGGGHTHGIVSGAGHGHGGGSYVTSSAGGHSHPSAGGHDHSVGGPTVDVGAPSGSFWDLATSTHSHNVGSASGHTHGTDGSHTHGNITGTSGTVGDHNHGGDTGTGAGHTHNVTGLSGSRDGQPPFLNLLYVIKAVAGGDPAVEGTYIEVRDEGVPDVPAAAAVDFRGAGVDVSKSGTTAVVTIGSQSGVTDHGALTGLADDDHGQYLVGDYPGGTVLYLRADGTWATPAGGGSGTHPDLATHDALGLATDAELSAGLAAHTGLVDPHTQYTTQAELDAATAAHTAAEPHFDVAEIDHGSIAGMADDDHPQYLNAARHLTTPVTQHAFPGGTTTYLRADGTWATPAGGGGSSDHTTLTGVTADQHHAQAHAAAHAEAGADPLVGYTGLQTNVGVDAVASNGVSTSLKSRGDHGHRLTTYVSNPAALGTAAPGTSGAQPSRGDHVHPTTGLALSTDLTTHAATPHGGAAHAASHTEGAADGIAGYTGTMGGVIPDTNGAPGTANVLKARGDHTHRLNTYASPAAPVGTAAAGTSASAPSRGDHVHSAAHSALTGVTADQHHVQQHAADAAAHHTFPGGTTNFLRADGTFAAPPGGAHPDLATHDALGLQTDAAAATHAAAGTLVHRVQDLTDVDFTAGYPPAGNFMVMGALGKWVKNDHTGAADPHTGYRLESADHTHASTGLQGGTIDHGALTGLADDDHPQYETSVEAAAKITAHEALSNPHTGYATDGDLTTHAATPHGGTHPDLATHDTLGLATQTELDAHTGLAHDARPGAFRGVSLYLSADISVGGGSVVNDFTTNMTEVLDAENVHSGSGSSFTVPAAWNGLKARLTAACYWSTQSTGFRRLNILRDGTIIARTWMISGGTAETQLVETPVITLVTGQVFNMQAQQNSGSNILIQSGTDKTFFELEIVEKAASQRSRSVWYTPDQMGGAVGGTLTNYGTGFADQVRTREFSATADDYCTLGFRVPADWVPGTALAVTVHWAGSAATAGNVVWRVAASVVALAANVVTAIDATLASLTVAAAAVANALQRSTLTTDSTPVAAGDFVKMTVQRQGSLAGDTYAGTARLVGVSVDYTADA